jgi:DNA mismatch repair protein MutL
MNDIHNKHIVKSCNTKSLFPVTLELATPDAVLLEDLLPEIAALSYEIEPFGTNTFVIQGTPADIGSAMKNIQLNCY